MPNPTVSIEIDGSPVDYVAAGLHLESIAFSLDGGGGAVSAELTELRCDRSRTPTWKGGQTVAIDFDFGAGPVRKFTGRILSAAPMFTSSGWVISYQCAGIAEFANRIPVRNPSGMEPGVYSFNLKRNDKFFVPALSGKTVGEAVAMVLDDHAAALGAVGVTTAFPLSGGDLSQFTGSLTIVPPDPFTVSGEHLWDALSNLIEQWHSSWKLGLTPDGEIKLYNPFDAPTATLTWTEGSAAFEWSTPPSRDVSRCFSRVLITGQDDINPRYLKLSKGDLVKDWTSGEQNLWKYEDFLHPDTASRFTGTCTCTSSQVTFDPDDNALAFAADTYGPDGLQGAIFLRAPSLSGLVTETCTVWISSHTALTAGGTVVADIEPELATTVYTEGTWAAAAAGRAHVWRRYKVATQYQGLVRQYFPRAVPFTYSQAGSAMMTESPMVTIQYPGGESSLEAIIDPVNDTVTIPVPVTIYTNGQNATGAAVTAPDEVIACLPIKAGPLQVAYPPDVAGVPQYAGTSYTEEGIEETLHIYLNGWNSASAKGPVASLAEEYHKTVCNTVLRGSANFYEIAEEALGVGWALNVDGDGHATGFESAAIPVRSLTLRCNHSGGATSWSMDVALSNERRPFSGDRLYTRGIERPRHDGLIGAGTALEMGGVFSPGVSAGMASMGSELFGDPGMAGVAQSQAIAMGAAAGMQGLATDSFTESQGRALDAAGVPRDWADQALASGAAIGNAMMGGAARKNQMIADIAEARKLSGQPSPGTVTSAHDLGGLLKNDPNARRMVEDKIDFSPATILPESLGGPLGALAGQVQADAADRNQLANRPEGTKARAAASKKNREGRMAREARNRERFKNRRSERSMDRDARKAERNFRRENGVALEEYQGIVDARNRHQDSRRAAFDRVMEDPLTERYADDADPIRLPGGIEIPLAGRPRDPRLLEQSFYGSSAWGTNNAKEQLAQVRAMDRKMKRTEGDRNEARQLADRRLQRYVQSPSYLVGMGWSMGAQGIGANGIGDDTTEAGG